MGRFLKYLYIPLMLICMQSSAGAQPWAGGVALGWGYDSWELSSEVESNEMAALQLDLRAVFHLPLFKRLHLFPEIGGSYSMDSMIPMNNVPVQFGSYYIGSRFAWVLHPDFCPFIGGGFYLKFHDKLIDESNKTVFHFNFSAGSKILRLDESDFWVFLDYGLWNSKAKTYSHSCFILSFAYLFHF